MPHKKKYINGITGYQATIIFAIVVIVTLTTVAVVVLSIYGVGERTAAGIGTLMGLVMLVVVTLLNLMKTERVEHKTDRIEEKVDDLGDNNK